MPDRRDVHPHHLLRAALRDRFVRDVVAELGADPDQVLLTLDHRWLAAADTIDVEEVEAVGIELPMVLAAINPPFDGPPDWGGRHLTDATRDLLVRALGMRGPGAGPNVGSGQVFLALLSSKDHIVAPTLREHGLSLRTARPLVDQRSRRSP